MRSFQFSPSFLPNQTSKIVQGIVPSTVQIKNGVIEYLAIPAGKEINVRTPGSKRPINTAAPPYLLNNFSASSNLCSLKKIYLPYLSSKGRPPY